MARSTPHQRPFYRVPNALMDHAGRSLGSDAVSVYNSLARHADHEGRCWPSVGRIGEQTSLSRVTVIKGLKKLESAGIITVVRQKGQHNEYCLMEEDAWKIVMNPVCAADRTRTSAVPDQSVSFTGTGSPGEPEQDLSEQDPLKNTHEDRNEALRLATLLFELNAANNPNSQLAASEAAKRETTARSGAQYIRALLRQGQDHRTIEAAIRFAMGDCFWQTVVHNGKKLHRNWDTLTSQMKRGGSRLTNPDTLDPRKRYLVYGGLGIEDGKHLKLTPEQIVQRYGVDPEECILVHDSGALRERGIDPQQYIVLRPSMEGSYVLPE